MGETIRELRRDDLDAVVRAVEQAGVSVDRGCLVHSLSLGAFAVGQEADGPGVLGAVLCVRDEQGVALEVVCGDGPPEPGLVRRLIDKALAKVQAAQVRVCRVRIHGELAPEHDPLATGADWFARFEQHQAA